MSAFCSADVGHPCDANDGDPCEKCEASIAESEANARRAYERATAWERNPVGYRADLIAAGRGHLLREAP